MVRKNKKSMEVKKQKASEVRYLFDLKKILYDKNWFKRTKNFPVYYIWRNVKQKNGLRYDVTIIPSKMLGQEFVKTKGHYHSGRHGEIYIILKGEGIFLIQREKNGKIKDVYSVKAKKGDHVVIPPRYGHVTINPSSKKLEMANWISKKCKSDYKRIERKEGGCYYYLKSGWIKNKNYKSVPKLRFEKPKRKMPENLGFLYGGNYD